MWKVCLRVVEMEECNDSKRDEMMKVKHQRNSRIELLKVFAIIMIVFSHAIPNSGEGTIGYIDLTMATTNVQNLVLVVLKYLGQVANVIFIVSSSWFLLDSEKVKMKKATDIILDSFLISALFLLIYMLLGYSVSVSEIVKHLFPITMNSNWFVGCYLLFYLIHPALNVVVNYLGKRKLLVTNLVLLFLYCGVNLLISDRYYYTQLVGFICIYFMVAYMKKYLPEFVESRERNVRLLIVSLFCFLSMIFITNILGLKIWVLRHSVSKWSIIVNPFIILMVLAMFNLANARTSYKPIINYISSLSLLVYMIHADRLLMYYTKMDFFAWVYKQYSYDYILLWVLLVGSVLLIAGVIFSVIYKNTIQRARELTSNCVEPIIKKTFQKLVDKIMQIT